MSVVAAVKQGDRVWMAADTQTTRDMDCYTRVSQCNRKISRLDNGLLVSWTGQTVAKQVVLSHPEVLTFDESKGLTKKHIVRHIVPRLFALFEEEGILEEGDGGFPMEMPGTMLLVYKDKIFEITRDFEVIRYEDYQATGSGANSIAYGLSRIDKDQDINDQLVKLLKISTKHTTTVGAPFVLIDTKDLQYVVRED